MRVFIPTYGRAGKVTTGTALGGIPYTLVVHTEDQAAAYRAAGETGDMLVSQTPPGPYGAWHQRRFICEHTERTMPGEWYAVCDDDVTAYQAIAEETRQGRTRLDVKSGRLTTAEWQEIFRHPVSGDALRVLWDEQVAEAERRHHQAVGWQGPDNPFFRGPRWSSAGTITGWMYLWKATPIDWGRPCHMEDIYMAACRLRQDGGLLVDHWARAVSGAYQPGGYGGREERLPYQQEAIAILEQDFPGLWKPVYSEGRKALGVRLRPSTREAVLAWRRRYMDQMRRPARGATACP
jgi:hypothetical protein